MNEVKLRQTLIGIAGGILILAAFIVVGLYWNKIRVAIKVTDPTSAYFNPMWFRFDDYRESEIGEVVATMFPIGTERSYVRAVMDASNATNKEKDFNGRADADFYGYTLTTNYPGRSNIFLFVFSPDQKLKRIATVADESRILIGK